MFKKLGVDYVINYREDVNWGEIVCKLIFGGEGVEYVIEVGGVDIFIQSLSVVKMEGVIFVIGFFGGVVFKDNIFEIFFCVCIVCGVYVGFCEQFEVMCVEIEKYDIYFVMDKIVFIFEKVKEVYEYMWVKKYIGKIFIMIE